LVVLITSLLAISMASMPTAAQTPSKVGQSGLPLPRYVSLKSDRVNLRQGPGTDYPTTGWILSSLLSGRRTALVLPWTLKPGAPRPQVPLLRSDSAGSGAIALLEAGVIADVQSCDGAWCYVAIDSYKGYLEQTKLWGVYARERVK